MNIFVVQILNIMDILRSAHSGLRYVVLILILAAIFNALKKRASGNFSAGDKKLNTFAMIFMHVQVTLGLVMYFISDKVQFVSGWMSDKYLRFFGMEHILMMIIAAVLLTIGKKKAEKESNIYKKHNKIVIWYTVVLIIVFAAIPWPFRGLTNSWF